MLHRRPITCLALSALPASALLPAAALAQTSIDETRPASAATRIAIEDLIVGTLRVIGWDRDEMQVTGTIGADVDRLVIDGSARGWEITPEWDEDWDWDDDRGRNRNRNRNRDHDHRDLDVDLEIRAPRGATIHIEGITVTVDLEDADGDVNVETVTGHITYRGASRHLELTTVTGTIEVEAAEVDRLDVETVQGRIEFTGGFAAGARASFEAVGGSVILRIPADSSATFDLETMMGSIENDFNQEPRRENRWVPSSELHFSLGGGSARVSVETLQGRIEVRRQ